MNIKFNKRIIIAAGGTGGHVFPGLAIADELKLLLPNARIVFVGTARGLEAKIMPEHGWPLILLKSLSIKDRRGFSKLLAYAILPYLILKSIIMVLSDRPAFFISIGGYAAGPMAIAAWICSVPIAVIEPNAVAGFTNRIIGRLSKRAFISFDEAARYFPKGRAAVIGNPVRGEVMKIHRRKRNEKDKFSIFVFGGSQGARSLNQAMMSAAGELKEYASRISIIHQAGKSDDIGAIAAAYESVNIEAEVFQFIDSIWGCYERADLVIARAGATTIAELRAVGLPSILIPYPFAADDHQRANAECMVRAGAARMIADVDCSGERFASEIIAMLKDPGALDEMARRVDIFAPKDSAEKIARSCVEIAGIEMSGDYV